MSIEGGGEHRPDEQTESAEGFEAPDNLEHNEDVQVPTEIRNYMARLACLDGNERYRYDRIPQDTIEGGFIFKEKIESQLVGAIADYLRDNPESIDEVLESVEVAHGRIDSPDAWAEVEEQQLKILKQIFIEAVKKPDDTSRVG